ncbi:hypothetical protein HK100_012066, partial [Physocladia obscura]
MTESEKRKRSMQDGGSSASENENENENKNERAVEANISHDMRAPTGLGAADVNDSDSDVGPMPVPEQSTSAKLKKQKKPRVLAHESLYLANLPQCDMYEKSLMHRDTVNFVTVTTTDFVITTSVDGHVKFWKKAANGIDFVKHYRAHLGPVVAVAASSDGIFFASAGADKAVKIFDVINFGTQLSDLESSAIHIYDARESQQSINKIDMPIFTIPTLHSQSVHIMQYNPIAKTIVSVDQGGMIEYWVIDEDLKQALQPPLPLVDWEFKSDTDLYEFKKSKSSPSTLTFSPDYSKFVTFGFDDRQIRIFNFKTGKLLRKYDESLSVVSEMQQAGTAAHRIDDMEFGRRLAMEKEIEKSKGGGQSATANAIFDESGYFIIYATILGIKIVNIETNRVSRLIGKMENQR